VVRRRSGGRPSTLQSGQIQEMLLDNAAELFLAEGYGAVSIEKIAARCRMSKRTFYHRFANKEELFAAVAHRLITRMKPEHAEHLFEGKTLEAILLRLAEIILHAALSPEALALHRIILAEAKRFPELAAVMETEGSKAEAITRIAALLESAACKGEIRVPDAGFAAEQFLQMVIGVPQRRAMGAGSAMTNEELAEWTRQTVALFLNGCRMS